MLYQMHEAMTLMLAPARAAAAMIGQACENPFHPLAYAPTAPILAAGCALFERTTRSYGKPAFALGVSERIVWERPFCRVIAFGPVRSRKPKLLIVAPLSGHYATQLRGTVEAFLDTHRVFVTDWADASQVPLVEGGFGLSDYIDCCIALFEALGPGLNVMAVCQASVPVLAAIARMEEDGTPGVPRSAVLVGGPVDTRVSPTAIDALAAERGVDWFACHCICKVPANHPGRGRAVYPGFLQRLGFASLRRDRDGGADREGPAGEEGAASDPLIAGGRGSVDGLRRVDDDLAVMDLPAEFYLDTVRHVFVEHSLPQGRLIHHGRRVTLAAIRRCGLMVIEGERDEITGIGQSRAALSLTPDLEPGRKAYHLQTGIGHYGLFDGARFRAEIAPRIAAFVAECARRAVPSRPRQRRGGAGKPAARRDRNGEPSRAS